MRQYIDLLDSYEKATFGYMKWLKILLQFRTNSEHEIWIEVNDIFFIGVQGE